MNHFEAEPEQIRVRIFDALAASARQPCDLDVGVIEENAQRFAAHVAGGSENSDTNHALHCARNALPSPMPGPDVDWPGLAGVLVTFSA